VGEKRGWLQLFLPELGAAKGRSQFFNTFLLIFNLSPLSYPAKYFTFFSSYNHSFHCLLRTVYAVHHFTIGVGVNNNRFEYWSSNYLGYTMSYTSTCPITYFTPKNVTN
jgi:hypothetical protein